MNKRDLRKRSHDEQEQHLALWMSSSERLMPEGRERAPAQNNSETKAQQLKLSKIYSSTWS
jgi:hypothetical protein